MEDIPSGNASPVTPPPDEGAKGRRKRNALKHGLYARRFSPDELARLREMSPEDLRPEIALIRVLIHRLLDQLDSSPSHSQFTAYSDALVSHGLWLNATVSTHALVTARDGSLLEPLEQALNRFRAENDL